MSELNIGIVGLGRLGRRHALNLRDRIRGARLVAACSPLDEELGWAAEHLPGVHRHHTLDAMLAEPDVQAVFLVTPTALHAEQIIACLRAGKHVFCEKPLALNVEDCQKVEAVAADYPQLKAMVGLCAALMPAIRTQRTSCSKVRWASLICCVRKPAI
jgi:myo-inositol 2-dehydrogenase/D-chiro-inositol 1-dehydrogenase